TAANLGLRVAMSWPGSGDLDLHLHDADTAHAWYSADDCYYANPTPQWNVAEPVATGENPEMLDSVSGAVAPELAWIDTPVIGQNYTVAVHHYSDCAGCVATVAITCSTSTAATATFVSRPLNGTLTGNCSPNDFWKVATVSFSSPTLC